MPQRKSNPQKQSEVSLIDVVMAFINGELDYAREKHPEFPESFAEQASIIGEEYGEFCKETNDIISVLKENPKSTVEIKARTLNRMVECSHIVATCIRTMESFFSTCGASYEQMFDLYQKFCKEMHKIE